ncbi:hypothetical protein BpHYR1_028847 [Brachionus plicatilis]|uniref:Uncharacterized protein n=1 Tax=Brachionus plicatilis TaxID=10195 RepID=A0A3M7P170_BRAPC|nr:hypothetical protein BpHYR1_028847 [Brachionus plicatilis]
MVTPVLALVTESLLFFFCFRRFRQQQIRRSSNISSNRRPITPPMIPAIRGQFVELGLKNPPSSTVTFFD